MAQPLDNLTRTWTSGATESGIKLSVTDPGAAAASNLLELRGGAAGTTSRFSVGKLGEVTAASLAAPVGTALYLGIGTVFGGVVRIDSSVFGGMRGLRLTNESQFGWSSDTTSYGTADLILARDAANTLAQRNGDNGQTFRVYGRGGGTANFERVYIDAPTTAGTTVVIGTEKGGTGTNRALSLATNSMALTISTNAASSGLSITNFPATVEYFRFTDTTFHLIDSRNIAVGTTTGTKLGTATTQKLAFWDKTPVVQPTAVADATDAATVITQLNALLSRMRDVGLIAT